MDLLFSENAQLHFTTREEDFYECKVDSFIRKNELAPESTG